MARFQPLPDASEPLASPDTGRARMAWFRYWADLLKRPFHSASSTDGIGYTTGAGGTVTQLTDKSTAVTLNKVCGQITMHGAALGAGAAAGFTFFNSTIGAGDLLLRNHASGGLFGAYAINSQCSAGAASIHVRNTTGGSLSEAVVISFALVKATTS